MQDMMSHLAGSAAALPLAATEDAWHAGLNATRLAGLYVSSAFALYVLLIIAGRTLKRRFRVHFGPSFHLFCAAVALYLPTLYLDVPAVSKYHLGAASIILGAFVLVGLIRHYLYDIRVARREGAQIPKFLGEFVSIAIIVGAFLFVLQFVYGYQVPGLLAGAGIIGLVLGLALQDTLGNIFSGLAIYFGGQFKAGDWLLVDGHHARIVDINWRSTRLHTTDDLSLDIPNSAITKQTVINYSSPTSVHGMRIEFGLDYDAPPALVKSALVNAALDCPHVLREPAPSVFVKKFADWSITYELRFWLDDHSKYSAANSQIHTALWYSLKRHGITIPYPIQLERSLDAAPPRPAEDREHIRDVLQKSLFAPVLSGAQLEAIVARSRVVRFGAGESIIRQGDAAGPMYLLTHGRAEVWVEADGKKTRVAEIGPGACIGETSVLTGEPRSATVVAEDECSAVEVETSTLAPIICASPELLEALSALLARRRMENEGIVSSAASANKSTETRYQASLLDKLKKFFQV